MILLNCCSFTVLFHPDNRSSSLTGKMRRAKSHGYVSNFIGRPCQKGQRVRAITSEKASRHLQLRNNAFSRLSPQYYIQSKSSYDFQCFTAVLYPPDAACYRLHMISSLNTFYSVAHQFGVVFRLCDIPLAAQPEWDECGQPGRLSSLSSCLVFTSEHVHWGYQRLKPHSPSRYAPPTPRRGLVHSKHCNEGS